ncbi:MAG: Uma2 family endonuclease [Endozoicomonas sp.]
MTGIKPERALVTFEDYLAREQGRETRHEFVDGEVVAMAGASIEHNIIAGNLFAFLHGKLAGQAPCRPFISDMRVRVKNETMDRCRYPDVMVSCHEPVDSLHYDRCDLIAEVLSDGTAGTDRTEKMSEYSHVLKGGDYLLVSQYEERVERITVKSEGVIDYRVYGPEDEIELTRFEFKIPVSAIYTGISSVSEGT